MIAEGDPVATAMAEQWEVVMPNFRLDEREIDDLIRYMADETRRLQARHSAAVTNQGRAARDHSGHEHATHGHSEHGHPARDDSKDDHPAHDHSKHHDAAHTTH